MHRCLTSAVVYQYQHVRYKGTAAHASKQCTVAKKLRTECNKVESEIHWRSESRQKYCKQLAPKQMGK